MIWGQKLATLTEKIHRFSLKWVIDIGAVGIRVRHGSVFSERRGRRGFSEALLQKAAPMRSPPLTHQLAVIATVVLLFLSVNPAAMGYPLLQLYLEGGTYDTTTQSWFLAPEGSSAGEPFRLWVIGDTSWKGTIEEVRLSMAYNATYRTYDSYGNILRDLVVTFTPTTTGGFGGFTDGSTPGLPQFLQYGAAGTQPVLGDGSKLPAHGIFGANTVWQEWLLGDFSLKDSPMGDFIGSVPPPDTKTLGQINVYEISVRFSDGASAHGVSLHFDAYNHVEGGNHAFYRFAPFSHDADGDVSVVPEPGSLVGLAGILLGSSILGGRSLIRRRRSAA